MSWEIDLVSKAPDKKIADKVVTAVRSLLASDNYLLRVDASERSISHRLATYLSSEFAELDVDCEYNRDHHETKRLFLPGPCERSTTTDGSPVYPDIIVHRRGTAAKNVLVVEIKKSTSTVSDDCDLEKLSAFRSELNYTTALFLRLKCGVEDPTVSSFEWI